LDRFKTVNDAHGHLVGSELLGQVGKYIQKPGRSTDLCYRYGGDEFVLLMPRTTREEAVRMTRSIHSALSGEVFHLGRGLELKIGASAGLAACPGDGRTVHS